MFKGLFGGFVKEEEETKSHHTSLLIIKIQIFFRHVYQVEFEGISKFYPACNMLKFVFQVSILSISTYFHKQNLRICLVSFISLQIQSVIQTY